MKTYKWFFLIFLIGTLISCQRTSEEELIGDWRRGQTFPGHGRSHATTFVIDDKGYVIGGFDGSNSLRRELFIFDHTAGERGAWLDRRYIPNEMTARQQAVGFSLYRKGYIGTGWAHINTDRETFLSDFWQYDPVNESWIEVAPLPGFARRGAFAFALSINGKEYGFVGGGYMEDPEKDYLNDFWMFDPEGETEIEGKTFIGKWRTLQESGYAAYRGGKRAGAVVFVIDNKAYICTGENSQGNITDFWVFDPNASGTNQWRRLRQMANSNPDEDYDDDYAPLARAFGVAYVAMVDGQLRGHIVGGRGSGHTNWEYNHNPVSEGGDLWVQRTKFYNNITSSSREGMISFSFPSSGRAFAGAGRTGVAFPDDFWEFIPLVEDYTYNDHQ